MQWKQRSGPLAAYPLRLISSVAGVRCRTPSPRANSAASSSSLAGSDGLTAVRGDHRVGAQGAHRRRQQERGVGAAGERHHHRAEVAQPLVEVGQLLVEGHRAPSSRTARILTAAQAAPKPLSMPTTVTPGLHEAIIPSSAVTPAKPGAVAGAGRHRDHRRGGQAGDDAGQRALHAGDHQHHVGGRDPVLLLEHPVQAGDADVGDHLRVVSVRRQHGRGLTSHRQVAGAGGEHQRGTARSPGASPR